MGSARAGGKIQNEMHYFFDLDDEVEGTTITPLAGLLVLYLLLVSQQSQL